MQNLIQSLLGKLGNKVDEKMEALLTLVAVRGSIKARRIGIRSFATELLELDPDRADEYRTALEALKR